MKKCRLKVKILNIGDYVCIKIDKVDKMLFYLNVLIGEILVFENDYVKVVCKFGIIFIFILLVRLVKC